MRKFRRKKMIDEFTLLKVQYNWVVDIVKRMEVVLASDHDDEDKIQQLKYLVKQALKAEKPDND
jgi:hypothetical protein